MSAQAEKAALFKTLHEGDEAFILPNPWDIGTAQTLAGMGAKALATTSAGFAFTIGKFDSVKGASREEAIAHAKAIAEATTLPVSGDFENGYGDTPADVAETVKQAIEAGLVGCSIEDSTMSRDDPAYGFEEAVARIEAGVEAARSVDFPFQFCARADGVMIGAYDLDEAIRRLQAFEKAGADVLYAPYLSDLDALKKVCTSLTRPVNALASGPFTNHNVAELSAAGARRISLGSSLFNVAMDAFYHCADALLENGDLTAISKVRTGGKIHKARKAGKI